MATTFNFNNTTTSVPGVLSKVDASALTQAGLTATGRVAILGTAVGGRPYSAIASAQDFVRITQPSQVKALFRSGDLLEAATIAFDPSSDTAINGGAQQVVAMKVNPSTAASATLGGALGPCLTVTSQDYGAFTNHIGVQISEGSSEGFQVTVSSDTLTETGDNLGGTGAFSLTYNGGSHGYTTMAAGVTTAGNVYATGTISAPSLASDISGQSPSDGAYSISVDSRDNGLAVTLYGVDANGAAMVQNLVLGGSNVIEPFASLLGVACWSAPNGYDIVITAATGGETVLTLAAGKQFAGVQPLSYAYVAQTTVSAKASGLTAVPLMLIPAGNTTQAELLTLEGGDEATSVGSYNQLAGLVTGGLGSQTVTLTAKAVETDIGTQTTVGSIVSYFDARSASVGGTLYGFDAQIEDATTSAPAAQLDAVAPSDCLAPAEASFGANLYSIVNWINGNSSLVSAAVPEGAQGAPSTTATPVFLSGGSDGIATYQDYTNALNLLQMIDVDTVVALSCDPAISALVDAHCAYMNSPKGGSERNGFCGLQDASLTNLPSKKEALAQAQALNTRNISAIPQSIVRYDTSGALREFPPQFTAVAAAGMQAGASVGTSLTRKYIKAQAIKTHPSWNPSRDAEDMIQGGLLFLRLQDGAGYRFVRDVTTYLQSDNLAYVERGVNFALNYAVKNCRLACDFAIGKPAFAGTATALQGVLKGELDLLVRAGVLTTYRAPSVSLSGDTFLIEIPVAPQLPTNFIGLTLSVLATTTTTTSTAA